VDVVMWVLVAMVSGAACWAAVALHEGAHALAATVLRVKVTSVEIGGGRRIGSLAVKGVPVVIAMLPFAGVTRHRGVAGRHAATRAVLLTAAGPLANLVVGAVLLAVAPPDGPGGAAARVVAVVNLGLGALTLVPVPRSRSNPHASDGWTVMAEILRRPAARRQRMAALDVTRAGDLAVAGRYGEAIAVLERVATDDPASARGAVGLYGTCLVETGDREQGDRAHGLTAFVWDASVPAAQRALLANALAWDVMIRRRPFDDQALAHAERMARLAHRLRPEDVNVLNTLAVVLVHAGRAEEADMLATRALRRLDRSAPELAAQHHAAAALVAAALGRSQDAAAHRHRAAELDVACPLLPHIDEALGRDIPPSPPAAASR
jgi:hypothetical protein